MSSTRLSLFAWSCRQLARQPGTAWLTAVAIFALVTVATTTLLLVEAWTETSRKLLNEGPSLVVRRIDAGGWQAMPHVEAAAAASKVIGVTGVEPRVHGVARGPQSAVTIVGVTEQVAERLEALRIPIPGPGQAWVGDGIDEVDLAPLLRFVGPADSSAFEVLGHAEAELGMIFHDVVLMTEEDARRLLGLAPGESSDLAVEVFHEESQDAIVAELAAAFDWPVRITTRKEAVGQAITALSRDGALRTSILVPAFLALALLILVALRRGNAAVRELGLYKALGWSTGDVVRMQLYQAIAVALPSVLAGLAVAATLVFWPGVRWPAELLLSWSTSAPPLHLDPGGAVIVLFGVAGCVLVPWLLASLLPALRSATVDPQDLLRGGSS
jgi:hypothetical protein